MSQKSARFHQYFASDTGLKAAAAFLAYIQIVSMHQSVEVV